MKQQLLRMLEWDHKARYGWAYDTWSRGKRLKEWIDPDVLADLDPCWSGFGTADTTLATGGRSPGANWRTGISVRVSGSSRAVNSPAT
ncbi:MAG: aminoglycoside 6-adenylyltransferase [Chloroflexi bacterium]|nr:aminoglycoside 6-adenylyltransferase [Chloroflexota bacterium]